jgi:MinD-like ATPase involved in chromosome partitioning or flagellar assembly
VEHVLIACWSAKGGSGTTVVAAGLAVSLGRSAPGGVLLVDLCGDVPSVLGVPEPSGPGLGEWLAAGDTVPIDALARLEQPVSDSIQLLPAGGQVGPVPPGRGDVLAAVLAAEARPVVVDCGSGRPGAGLSVAGAASVSLLVLRPCYLALRRAVAAPVRPSGVVLVDEPGRALGRDDVEGVLGVPVKAVVRVDPAIARAVDAGVFLHRLPRRLERALRCAA